MAPVEHRGSTQKNAAVDFATRFGKNLAYYRERAGLSQEELGVRASLHRTAVGQLERGERVARADTVVKLAGSLSITPETLLEGLEWTPGGTMIGQLTVSDN
jgi:transcriptional regulator with XRE-family HTH domain